MRYLNWDVLLFPDQSRVPLQEFDVKCHVLPATEGRRSSFRPSHASAPTNLLNLPQTPTLTGFVCSLKTGKPFRVSVHCWESPWPSDSMLSFKTVHDAVAYEIRVYLDGHLKAARLITESSSFPEIIDVVSAKLDGSLKPLCFPPFHKEVLQQSTWNANDDRGRIKVVISDVLRRGPQSHMYERVQEVAAFSFQHVPRDVLEYARIAWPNPHILQKLAASFVKRVDPDAHAHSPTKATIPSSDHQHVFQSKSRSGTPTLPIAADGWSLRTTVTGESSDDPFVDSKSHHRSQSHYRAGTDLSMRGDGHSLQSSEMSGVSIARPNFERQLEQANIQEILQALSPKKRNALLQALSPPDHVTLATMEVGSDGAQPEHISTASRDDRSLRPMSRNMLREVRRLSVESKHSTSNNSSALSWQGNPALSSLWTEGLPAHSSDENHVRSVSATSKRKRSLSQISQREANEPLLTMRGMSTSPCKKVSSAKTFTSETVAIE